MWQFAGEIRYQCTCGQHGVAHVNDFDINCVGSDERQMGSENAYELTMEVDCAHCDAPISLTFVAYEYPAEFLNYVESEIKGAVTEDQPRIEHLPDRYDVQQFELVSATASEIIHEIKAFPEVIRDINSRQFEEVIAELFRAKGFQVELTKRTRDGGKDIIAISTDQLGFKLKYFIECKHYAEGNKVGIDIVRALHGVRNTKDGANKTVLVTTSSFTSDARDFADNQVSSSWDMSLADYNEIMRWIGDYGPRQTNTLKHVG